MDRKIIFFDIDGTLVSHVGKTHIPKPTVKAVKALRRNGHVTAIATARNLALTRKTAAFFGIELVVCCNGAQAVKMPRSPADGEQILYETCLDSDFVRLFRDEAIQAEMSYAMDAEHIYMDWDSNKDFLNAFVDKEAGPGCKRNFAELERAQLAYMFAPLPARWKGLGDKELVNVDAMEFPSHTEFRPCGVSKWSGILKAAAIGGFDGGNIVTVGDGLNDIEMISGASLGIAVGGAKEELKAAADFVTDDIDKGGILSAFRELNLL